MCLLLGCREQRAVDVHFGTLFTSQLNQMRKPARKLEMTKKQSVVYMTSRGVKLIRSSSKGSCLAAGSCMLICRSTEK